MLNLITLYTSARLPTESTDYMDRTLHMKNKIKVLRNKNMNESKSQNTHFLVI